MITKSKKNEGRQVHPLELLLPNHLLAVRVHFLLNCAKTKPCHTVQFKLFGLVPMFAL